MRVLLFSAGILLATTAGAQQIENGDFENDWVGWSDLSSDGCNFLCLDGTAEIVNEVDVGLAFPSSAHALLLTTGDDDRGFLGGGSYGRVRSESTLVTWKTLGWEHIAEDREQTLVIEIFTAAGGSVASTDVDPSVDSWTSGAMDLSPACGQSIGVEITASLDQSGWGDPNYNTLWDDVAMGGVPCDQYVDLDGDGFCLEGFDLDGDGNCADEGEPDETLSDCDDDDPNVYPGAVDIGGNGIDENCDGYDEDAESTDPGSSDPGTTMPTGDDDDEDDDDGIASKSDSEGLMVGAGGGCGCDTGGSSPLGLFAVLALALIRRR